MNHIVFFIKNKKDREIKIFLLFFTTFYGKQYVSKREKYLTEQISLQSQGELE